MRNFNNPLSNEICQKRKKYRKEDVRGPYFRDQTAIIHSSAFRRLKGKTQVFFAPENDHICTRIEHVLHVSTISSAICRGLNLDVDLAQAIALGHDLGHPPFGHSGEEKIAKFSSRSGFSHEIHGLRVVDLLENYGEGLNLTYAVRDGIVSHCGEKFEQYIVPRNEFFDLSRIEERNIYPCTQEGCIVRMSDKIAYMGRDMEDAIRAGLIKESDIPSEIIRYLGSKNGEMIDSFVRDFLEWSLANGKIGFSPLVHELMTLVKEFNYEKIYKHPILLRWQEKAQGILEIIFNYLGDRISEKGIRIESYVNSDCEAERRFGQYLEKYKKLYVSEGLIPERLIIDYISGMTDEFAMKTVSAIIYPSPIKFD